jgi:hypothetical protein
VFEMYWNSSSSLNRSDGCCDGHLIFIFLCCYNCCIDYCCCTLILTVLLISIGLLILRIWNYFYGSERLLFCLFCMIFLSPQNENFSALSKKKAN